MKRFLLILALGAAVYFGLILQSGTAERHAIADAPEVSRLVPEQGDAVIERAFASRTSDLQVAGQGTVVKLLKDDNHGSRHQRFIVRLKSGRTLLVSHNIDLAPRIDTLRTGDTIAFYGEYVWNSKGGVIHWTHHDPQGRHPAGWIRHGEQTYQ
jgi:hypothetical protein